MVICNNCGITCFHGKAFRHVDEYIETVNCSNVSVKVPIFFCSKHCEMEYRTKYDIEDYNNEE